MKVHNRPHGKTINAKDQPYRKQQTMRSDLASILLDWYTSLHARTQSRCCFSSMLRCPCGRGATVRIAGEDACGARSRIMSVALRVWSLVTNSLSTHTHTYNLGSQFVEALTLSDSALLFTAKCALGVTPRLRPFTSDNKTAQNTSQVASKCDTSAFTLTFRHRSGVLSCRDPSGFFETATR